MARPLFSTALEHHQAGRLADAERLYRMVLMEEPNHADALNLLGVLAAQLCRFDDAVALIGRACALCPDVYDYHRHLGGALSEKRDYRAAADAYRQALRLNPACHISHDCLGAALRETGHLDEALACHRRSLDIVPGNLIAHLNLGLTLRKKGLVGEAMAAYRRAIEIDPDACDAHWNLSVLLLLHGDYEQGWREYEWRFRRKDFPTLWPPLPRQRWNGEGLAGKTLLVHTEQGFGDGIQFVRYVPMLAARSARVVLLCQKPLARLLESVDGVAQLVPGMRSPDELPPFDLHCPMMSLPLLLGRHLESVPANVPYLRPDSSLVQHWRAKVAAAARMRSGRRNADGLKVGLAWAGNPDHINDSNRSITLEHLAPLAGTGATFYSLQKGPAASQAVTPPHGLELIDLTQELNDFADTAALVSNLDLVIAVDTAVVHLAGALGIPAWVLIAGDHDWRWMLDREDSPWYPSMRLFRQRRPGHWRPVVERVAGALSELDSAVRRAA